MQVCDWPVGASGLLYDRSWMVVNRHGVCLSQKREPRLCQILPGVHLSSGRLSLRAPGHNVHSCRSRTHRTFQTQTNRGNTVCICSCQSNVVVVVVVVAFVCVWLNSPRRHGKPFGTNGKRCHVANKSEGVSKQSLRRQVSYISSVSHTYSNIIFLR